MPENSQKSRGEEGCKFLGCNVVKYFIEERHGKCVLLGKRPSGGAIAGLQQHKDEALFFFFGPKYEPLPNVQLTGEMNRQDLGQG